jgi:hypothetical protein
MISREDTVPFPCMFGGTHPYKTKCAQQARSLMGTFYFKCYRDDSIILPNFLFLEI